METEASIVYQLLDEIRAANLNNDETLGERQLRSFMREKRASIISQTYARNAMVTEDEFQSFGTVDLVFSVNQYYYDIPPTIALANNMGIKITTGTGFPIPVMTSEAYRLAGANPRTKYMPRAFRRGSRLYIVGGSTNPDFMDNGSGNDANNANITSDKQVYLEAILYDPDGLSSYDWTKDPYPLAPELIAKLKNDVKRTSLSTILQTKSDEVTNGNNDTVRYHDRGNVQ